MFIIHPKNIDQIAVVSFYENKSMTIVVNVDKSVFDPLAPRVPANKL